MYKQVIILRNDLNMRKGKFCAQACHASLGALEECGSEAAERAWREGGCTKIVVQIESEQAIRDLYEAAKLAGLPAYLVTDAGRTEFNGPTVTSLGIGPAEASGIDKLTGNLKLL